MSRGGPRPGAGRPKNPAKKPTKKQEIHVRVYPETHEQFIALSEEQKALSQADIIAALVEKAHINKERQRFEKETQQRINHFLCSLPTTHTQIKNICEPVLFALIDTSTNIETRLETLEEAPLTAHEKIGLSLIACEVLRLRVIAAEQLQTFYLSRLDTPHIPSQQTHQFEWDHQNPTRELQNRQTNQALDTIKLERENEKRTKEILERNACLAQLLEVLNSYKPGTLH